MAKEIWKAVVGYEGLYEVSSKGRVRSVPRTVWRIWRPGWIKRKGLLKALGKHTTLDYPLTTLCKNGITTTFAVHTLILEAFVGPRPPKHQAMHLDGNSARSTLENLKWGTPSENNFMKRLHGTERAGETNGNSKLSDKDGIAIRKALAKGEPQRSIARRFGVSQAAISHINVGKLRSWQNGA